MDDKKKPLADNDTLFNCMMEASGVGLPDNEKKNLRKAFSSLMILAKRARPKTKERPWEVRMTPHYTPDFMDQNSKK